MENDRDIAIEKNRLNKPGLHSNTLELIEVELNEKISVEKTQSVCITMKNARIKLKKNKQHLLLERIKTAIYLFIFISDELPKQNFSDYISKNVNRDYNYLSNLFLGREGVTIEEYIIAQKIERVKELLVYTELSLSDIAYKLQYCSDAQLTNQFIKETGVSPAFYRLLRINNHSVNQQS
ncbi:MAG: AraC family transcriptional regulator [Bacteroidota bacterium]|nr:AraC family transcriptional regulator [Bacteroidota bacterium]